MSKREILKKVNIIFVAIPLLACRVYSAIISLTLACFFSCPSGRFNKQAYRLTRLSKYALLEYSSSIATYEHCVGTGVVTFSSVNLSSSLSFLSGSSKNVKRILVYSKRTTLISIINIIPVILSRNIFSY